MTSTLVPTTTPVFADFGDPGNTLWLHPISDWWQQVARPLGRTGAFALQSTMPTCAAACPDGARLYIVLVAWCVPWAKVDKAALLPRWIEVPAAKRRALVQQCCAFAAELAVDDDLDAWVRGMMQRDDVESLAALDAALIRLCARHHRCKDGEAPAAEPWRRRYEDRKKTSCWYATEAAALGARRCLEWALRRRSQQAGDAAQAAAQAGQLDCLRWIMRAAKTGQNMRAAAYAAACEAARAGHVSCLAYLLQSCLGRLNDGWFADTKIICQAAAEGGQLASLQFAREQGGCGWDQWTCMLAARNGHLDCLRYAHARGCLLSVDAGLLAARYGHVDCLRYALEHTPALTLEMAAQSTHSPACLEYIIGSQGVDWRALGLPLVYLRTGRAAMLQYVLARGAPWDAEQLYYQSVYASSGADLFALVHWATRDPRCAAHCTTPLGTAAQRAALESAAVQWATAWGHLPSLQYAYVHNFPRLAASPAAFGVSFEANCLVFAQEHGFPWADGEADKRRSWLGRQVVVVLLAGVALDLLIAGLQKVLEVLDPATDVHAGEMTTWFLGQLLVAHVVYYAGVWCLLCAGLEARVLCGRGL